MTWQFTQVPIHRQITPAGLSSIEAVIERHWPFAIDRRDPVNSMASKEVHGIETELNPPYKVHAPARQLAPFVFCSPHSGSIYPRHFIAQSRLDPLTLRRSEDCYVDELFQAVPSLGAPLIAARFPRAYLDVNREPYELDPALISDPLPDYANAHSVRVTGGLGTVARIVADGEEIYDEPISLARALARIETLYMPFHRGLTNLMEVTSRQFGLALLIDCHSMPSAAMTRGVSSRPDFVIGDRYGASCDARIASFIRAELAGMGYNVQMNRPYAGGYITENYGRPTRGWHALQIEINRGLYLNEISLERSEGFTRLLADLTAMVEAMFEELPGRLAVRTAAE